MGETVSARTIEEPDPEHAPTAKVSEARAAVEPSLNPSSEAVREAFEPYALAVEMADRVSARRASANNFFLSIQTSLLAAVGLADTTLKHVTWYSALAAALTGCAISMVWWLQLRSYQRLNQAKFEVINDLEKHLPAKLFTDEWRSLKKPAGSWRLTYTELGATERLVPWLLAALHLLLLLGRLLG